MGNANSDAKLRENPEQYCEDLLHSLKIADKRTYFAALPADIEHLARRYALRNDVGRYLLFSLAPGVTMTSLPRRQAFQHLHRRAPAPVRVEDLRPPFGPMIADMDPPIFDFAAESGSKKLASVLTFIELPMDDAPLMLVDTTALGSCTHFILFTRHGIYYRFGYDIEFQNDYIVAYLPVGTAFIPYYELITQDVGFDKERYVTIGRKHLTGSALRRQFEGCVKALRESLLLLFHAQQPPETERLDIRAMPPSPPLSFVERLLQCAAEWQNQYTFCFPAIPHIHVFAAMKGCTIESEENILVLFDNTIFSSAATSCVVFTPSAVIYGCSSTNRGFIPYEVLAAEATTLSITKDKAGVSVTNPLASHEVQCGHARRKELLGMLTSLQTFLRREPGLTPAPSPQ